MEDPATEVPQLVNVLLTGKSSERRAAIERNFYKDAAFAHPFFLVFGKDAIYWVYEGWSILNRRKVTYDAETSVLSTDGSLVTVAGYTHVNPFFWAPFLPTFHVKIISLVTLRDDGEGRKVVAKQHDCHMWLGSIAHSIPGFQWLYEVFYRRVCGAFTVLFMQLLFMLAKLFGGDNDSLDAPPPTLHQVAADVLTQRMAAPVPEGADGAAYVEQWARRAGDGGKADGGERKGGKKKGGEAEPQHKVMYAKHAQADHPASSNADAAPPQQSASKGGSNKKEAAAKSPPAREPDKTQTVAIPASKAHAGGASKEPPPQNPAEDPEPATPRLSEAGNPRTGGSSGGDGSAAASGGPGSETNYFDASPLSHKLVTSSEGSPDFGPSPASASDSEGATGTGHGAPGAKKGGNQPTSHATISDGPAAEPKAPAKESPGKPVRADSSSDSSQASGAKADGAPVNKGDNQPTSHATISDGPAAEPKAPAKENPGQPVRAESGSGSSQSSGAKAGGAPGGTPHPGRKTRKGRNRH